jgi:hypothetical protein
VSFWTRRRRSAERFYLAVSTNPASVRLVSTNFQCPGIKSPQIGDFIQDALHLSEASE